MKKLLASAAIAIAAINLNAASVTAPDASFTVIGPYENFAKVITGEWAGILINMFG